MVDDGLGYSTATKQTQPHPQPHPPFTSRPPHTCTTSCPYLRPLSQRDEARPLRILLLEVLEEGGAAFHDHRDKARLFVGVFVGGLNRRWLRLGFVGWGVFGGRGISWRGCWSSAFESPARERPTVFIPQRHIHPHIRIHKRPTTTTNGTKTPNRTWRLRSRQRSWPSSSPMK